MKTEIKYKKENKSFLKKYKTNAKQNATKKKRQTKIPNKTWEKKENTTFFQKTQNKRQTKRDQENAKRNATRQKNTNK